MSRGEAERDGSRVAPQKSAQGSKVSYLWLSSSDEPWRHGARRGSDEHGPIVVLRAPGTLGGGAEFLPQFPGSSTGSSSHKLRG